MQRNGQGSLLPHLSVLSTTSFGSNPSILSGDRVFPKPDSCRQTGEKSSGSIAVTSSSFHREWDAEQEFQLLLHVQEFGEKSWSKTGRILKKSAMDCRDRWNVVLRPILIQAKRQFDLQNLAANKGRMSLNRTTILQKKRPCGTSNPNNIATNPHITPSQTIVPSSVTSASPYFRHNNPVNWIFVLNSVRTRNNSGGAQSHTSGGGNADDAKSCTSRKTGSQKMRAPLQNWEENCAPVDAFDLESTAGSFVDELDGGIFQHLFQLSNMPDTEPPMPSDLPAGSHRPRSLTLHTSTTQLQALSAKRNSAKRTALSPTALGNDIQRRSLPGPCNTRQALPVENHLSTSFRENLAHLVNDRTEGATQDNWLKAEPLDGDDWSHSRLLSPTWNKALGEEDPLDLEVNKENWSPAKRRVLSALCGETPVDETNFFPLLEFDTLSSSLVKCESGDDVISGLSNSQRSLFAGVGDLGLGLGTDVDELATMPRASQEFLPEDVENSFSLLSMPFESRHSESPVTVLMKREVDELCSAAATTNEKEDTQSTSGESSSVNTWPVESVSESGAAAPPGGVGTSNSCILTSTAPRQFPLHWMEDFHSRVRHEVSTNLPARQHYLGVHKRVPTSTFFWQEWVNRPAHASQSTPGLRNHYVINQSTIPSSNPASTKQLPKTSQIRQIIVHNTAVLPDKSKPPISGTVTLVRPRCNTDKGDKPLHIKSSTSTAPLVTCKSAPAAPSEAVPYFNANSLKLLAIRQVIQKSCDNHWRRTVFGDCEKDSLTHEMVDLARKFLQPTSSTSSQLDSSTTSGDSTV